MTSIVDLKLNLGCGFQKKAGCINVDVSSVFMPDVQIDLTTEVWPWETSSVSECYFDFSMEQMGTTLKHLEHVHRELYRVCQPQAQVFIKAFHPRSDQSFLNPACTQRISPDFFHLLSMQRNLNMISNQVSNDTFGMNWAVNFDVTRFKYLISQIFQQDIESGKISETEIRRRMIYENNICEAFEVDLRVIKN